MLTKKTIGFIGCGNLAEALIKGLVTSKSVAAGQILASDRISERLIHIAEAYEIKVYNKNYEVAKGADIIFITVKPVDASGALAGIAPEINSDKLLISAAAGITTTAVLETLKAAGSKGFCPIIRAMPNTPAIVQQGVTALFAGPGASKEHLRLAVAVFEAVGKVILIEDEPLMDAVTGLSGSGPAYIFLIMEALVEAGVKSGIPQDAAKTLAIQTTLGAAKLAMESGKGLAELIRMVASPGGTTVEGLKKLDEAQIKKALIEAVEAAAKRAKEISESFR